MSVLPDEVKLRDDIKIQNVVATADLKQLVDLESFNDFEHLTANLELYKCGYVKDSKMIGRVTVFGSGKLISVGTKSPQQASDELKKAIKILRGHKLIKPVKIELKVQNILGRYDLKKKIPILQLARIMPKSLYEPDQFPGLIFRIKHSLVALIFSTGKGVLVGGTSFAELNQGLFEVERWMTKND